MYFFNWVPSQKTCPLQLKTPCNQVPTNKMNCAKPPLPPPKGKFGPEWHRILNLAVGRGDRDPERWADATLRFIERTREVKEARRHLQVYTPSKAPPPQAPVKKGVQEARCRAKTLEGKQCGFKATCGEFCKKHAIKTLE